MKAAHTELVTVAKVTAIGRVHEDGPDETTFDVPTEFAVALGKLGLLGRNVLITVTLPPFTESP